MEGLTTGEASARDGPSAVWADGYSCTHPGSDVPAFRPLSLRLEAGKNLGLAGTSGCGKSTFLYSVCGLIPHSLNCRTEGILQVLGTHVADSSLGALSQQVQLVQQRPEASFVAATVAEELTIGMQNFGFAAARISRRVEEFMHRFGLHPLRDRYPFSLSAGERQKVGLATALLLEPSILLLDEPTANLDPRATAEFVSIVAELRQTGDVSVLLAEHDLETLERIAEEIVWLEGREEILEQRRRRQQTPVLDGLPSGSLLVRAEGLTVEFDRRPALRDVSFELQRGEVVALIGPNGAGKTTLAQVISGLLKPTSGRCLVDCVDTNRAGLHETARKVGYVSQDPLLQLFASNCVEEVAFRGRNLGGQGSPEDVRALLDKSGLDNFAETHPMNLSVGQQRRLTTISQFLPPPDLLVVDEPTTGLDYVWADRVLSLAATHASTGGTVLLLTHDLDAVRGHATRILALKEGELAADMSVAEFFDGPSTSGRRWDDW